MEMVKKEMPVKKPSKEEPEAQMALFFSEWELQLEDREQMSVYRIKWEYGLIIWR